MFKNTIDKKRLITDKNGNIIVDFTTSIFSKTARGIDSYNSVRVTDVFQMRPDKVSFNEYGTDNNTEFILKYSGISNPFSLDKDDVLLIPNEDQAQSQMADLEEESFNAADQVKLYYKFTNPDFKSDSKSYDDLANKVIPSGVLDPTETGGFTVPYIADDGTTAITIRNGRMYFGEDAGPTAADDYSEQLKNALDQKCAVNGMSMTDFVRASVKNSLNKISTNDIDVDMKNMYKQVSDKIDKKIVKR